MSDPAYETALVRWAQRQLAPWDPGGRPVPVEIAGQRGGRQGLPYVSMKVLTTYGIVPGFSELRDDGAGGQVEVVLEDSEGTVSFSVFGDDHDRIARTLRLACYSDEQAEATREEALAKSIDLVVAHPAAGTVRITEGDGGAIDDRSVVDLVFRFVDQLGTATPYFIESAEATGCVAPDLSAPADPSETVIVDITPP